MGKVQDCSRVERAASVGVKREVVSASAHLEVISQESFVWRLEGMSGDNSSSSHAASCANCQRERTRNSHNHNNNNNNSNNNNSSKDNASKSGGRKGRMSRRKHQQNSQQQQNQQSTSGSLCCATNRTTASSSSSSTAPIVVHLKDAQSGALKLGSRQSTVDSQDSDVSRSTDEDQSSTSSASSSSSSNGAVGSSRRRGCRGGSGAGLIGSQHRGRGGRSSTDRVWSHIYGDVSSIPEFVPNAYHHTPHHQFAQQQFHPYYYPPHHYPQVWHPYQPPYMFPSHHGVPHLMGPETLFHAKTSPFQKFRSSARRTEDKSRKNLTALISVIEKAHRKEPTREVEPNLSQNAATHAKLYGSLLNNAAPASLTSGQDDAELKRRNMAECENVELICNDLSAAAAVTSDDQQLDDAAESEQQQTAAMSESSPATSEDSDQSDEVSVTSSSDTLSDDLCSDLLPALDCGDLSPSELQQLAEFTTGVPLVKYDCPVQHPVTHTCPQCVDLYPGSEPLFLGQASRSVRVARRSVLPNLSSGSSPRTSISSDSDVSSDVDDSSSTSSALSFDADKAATSATDSGAFSGSSSDNNSASNSHDDNGSQSDEQHSQPKQTMPTPQNSNNTTSDQSAPSSVDKPVKSATAVKRPVKQATASVKDVLLAKQQAAAAARQLMSAASQPRRRAARRCSLPHHHYYHHWHHHYHPHYGMVAPYQHYYNGPHDGPPLPHFGESVYLDLSGMDVKISVNYHNQDHFHDYKQPIQPFHHPLHHQHHHPRLDTVSDSHDNGNHNQHKKRRDDGDEPAATGVAATTTEWPYPVHSLFQALYSPTVTAPVQGIQLPLRFNNTVFYPLKGGATPPNSLKKYEMSIPPLRPWISIAGPDKEVPSAVFSTMCYNVLCDKLCTKTMYGYCPTWALSWDYRKKGIMRDILRGNADIITLQEVETEQFYSMFYPELAQQGYDGIFLPKSRVRTMNLDKEKKAVDGCAIFFRKSKFEKVNEYHVEFNQLATREGASNTDTDMINRVSTKDNIAIVAVLRTKPGAYERSPVPAPKGLSQLLMVSTAHIHWDPALPDVKLVQTMMLVEELQRFVREASVQFRPNAPPPPPAMSSSSSTAAADLCNSMPLILCGDFNSLPDSGVYEYLSKGRLDTLHQDFEGQNYQEFMKDRHANGVISHNFKLSSAYKDVMPFTNYTFDFKGIIDYIFYSDAHLRLHGVMGLQDEEWFRANKIIGCPHPYVPSDHFPLFAEFSLPAHPNHPALSGTATSSISISSSNNNNISNNSVGSNLNTTSSMSQRR